MVVPNPFSETGRKIGDFDEVTKTREINESPFIMPANALSASKIGDKDDLTKTHEFH